MRQIRFAQALLKATHFMPSIAVTTFVAMFAICLGLSAETISLLVLATLFQQFSVGLSNDWLDWQRDAKVHRTDKPAARGLVSPIQVRNSAVACLLLALAISCFISQRAFEIMLIMLCAGWSYNLWFKSMLISPLPYAIGFGVLPYFAVSSTLTVSIPFFIPLVAALLGCAAHFANTIPDFAYDDTNGIRGLPQHLGAGWSSFCIAATAATASLVTVFNCSAAILGVSLGCLGLSALLIATAIGMAFRPKLTKWVFRCLVLAALANLVPLCLDVIALRNK